MPEAPMDTLVVMLKRAQFDVQLGIDRGQFQNLVLASWPTILEVLEAEAKRRRHLSVVKK